MIYSLRGTLTLVEQNFIVVECAGVGYGIRTSAYTVGKLPRMGEEVKIFTHLSVREDAVELFGFITQQELRLFRLLTAVTGVGPKAAVAILSELPPDRLMLAVAAKDAKAITQAPGVGPKLAGRIVLELGDKIGSDELASGLAPSGTAVLPAGEESNAGEAVSALVALGYGPSEAASAVSKQKNPDASVQELIKGALRQLGGQK